MLASSVPQEESRRGERGSGARNRACGTRMPPLAGLCQPAVYEPLIMMAAASRSRTRLPAARSAPAISRAAIAMLRLSQGIGQGGRSARRPGGLRAAPLRVRGRVSPVRRRMPPRPPDRRAASRGQCACENVDAEDEDANDLADPHHLDGRCDPSACHRRDVDQPVLMDADIHEGAERGHVCDHASSCMPGLRSPIVSTPSWKRAVLKAAAGRARLLKLRR